MKFAAIALMAILAGAPVVAQVPGRQPMPNPEQAPAVGVTVVDTAGGPVGTIESISGDIAVINTGTNKVGFPLASMTPGPKGPIIAMTKVQLDASYAEQMTKAKADLQAKLTPGTAVRSRNGTASVGTIKASDAEFVTLTTVKGDVKLPVAGFSLDAQGVIIGMTAEEFNKAIGVN